MLAGARFGDHPRLAQPLREQRLAHTIVHLVRAGVIQVFALEVNLRAAKLLRPAPRVIHRTRPAHIVLELVFEFRHEFGIVLEMRVLLAQFVERAHQGLGHEHAAVRAEMAARVR